MPRHLAQIELAGKEILAVRVAEHARLVLRETTGRRRSQVRQHRHQFAGACMPFEHAMILAVDAAVNGMDQSVALTIARVYDKCRREDALALEREYDIDRVVHATGHD